MRLKSLLWMLVILFASSAVSRATPVRQIVPQGATSFASKNGRFSVWLPVKPTQNRVPVASAVILDFEANTQTLNYSIIVSDGPPGKNPKEVKSYFTAMSKDINRIWVKEYGTISTAEIQLGSFPGREFSSSFGKKQLLVSRSYVTPRSTYQIFVRGSKSELQRQAAQINRVFDSFRILPL